MLHQVLVFAFLLWWQAPVEKTPFDFSEVDQHARSVVKASTYEQTAEKLTAPFKSEAGKARAIFIWITDNLAYDTKKFKEQLKNPVRERIVAETREELEMIKERKRIEIAEKAFRKEKGVCEDYAYLFHYMCQHIGIESAFIPGYGRFSAQEINRDHRGSNHAWNAVKIQGYWYLLDATWAAGSTNMAEGKFTKDYKEGLFMTPPDRFILTHFPDDPVWQLLENPVKKEAFTELPYGFPELSSNNVIDYFPKKGLIKKNRASIRVGLEVENTELHYVIVDNRELTRFSPEKSGNKIIFNLPSDKIRPGELTVAVMAGQKLHPIISYIVER
jgi:transglutaminase/protease-like cytokinesis protein 3